MSSRLQEFRDYHLFQCVEAGWKERNCSTL
jgi:hypothetical protein